MAESVFRPTVNVLPLISRESIFIKPEYPGVENIPVIPDTSRYIESGVVAAKPSVSVKPGPITWLLANTLSNGKMASGGPDGAEL